jgi:hypothetical protein
MKYNIIYWFLKNRSDITKTAKIMLAMPFVVPKARLTLLRSSGFTIRCWYSRKSENSTAPVQ